MIRSASMKLGKKTLKLKFSTRALIRIEAENGGQSFDTLLDQLITGAGGVTLMASALGAGLNDGKGIDPDQALDLIDQAGGVRKLIPLVGDPPAHGWADCGQRHRHEHGHWLHWSVGGAADRGLPRCRGYLDRLLW